MEFLAAFSLRESFPLRIIFALAVFLIASGFFVISVTLLVEMMKKRMGDDDDETFRVLFHDAFFAKLNHWKYWCMLLGYLILFGEGPGEGMAYTFPSALYITFAESNELEWFWMFVLYLALPLLFVSLVRILYWLRSMKVLAVTLVLSHHIKAIGLGMLIGQGFELLARLISMGNPTSGGLRYFAFHLIVNQGQILFIAVCGILFVVGFFLSFLSTDAQKDMLEVLRKKREYEREHPSSGGGGDGGGMPGSAPRSKFPNYMQAANGDLYRLEYDSGDHATYVCDKTGDRQTVRDVELET